MSSARSSARWPEPEQFRTLAGFTPSPWVSAAEFAALRGHRELPGAVAAFATSLIDLYEGNTLLNALLCDRGRVLVGFFVLYLDVLPLPGTAARGATLGAVQALCRQTRLCSAGRAASVLAAMRFGGYVVPEQDSRDHRRRILVPARRLIEAHHQHWVRQFEAMSPVFPEAALVPARLETGSFRTAFLRRLGTYFLAGFRVLDHAPILTGLAESNAGLLILSSLALRQLTGEASPGEPAPISVSALARRFCVSRAHVRNMLSLAEQAGLLIHAPGSEHVTVRPALTEALIHFYGVLFMLFGRCAAGALHEDAARRNRDPLN